MIAEQLRKSILQAAIQGKLTEQLPEDGDARVLLKEIQKEKQRLIKEGKIKKDKPLPEIAEDEIPFEIPTNWCWVRLGAIGSVVGGGTPKTEDPMNWIRGTVPWLTPADMKNNGKYISAGNRNITEYGLSHSSAQLLPSGSVLFSSRAPIGYVAIANNPVSTNQGFKSVVPIMTQTNEYIYFYLLAMASEIEKLGSGTTFKEVSGSVMKLVTIPLPPLSEQQRIVERLEEALPVIDKLAGDETKLDELLKSFPKKMKDAILQAAIQGKLTEQLPEDGDARDLLKEIQKEKQRLIKEGKIKKDKPLPEIAEDEIPFEIPANWCWVRLGELARVISKGTTPSGGRSTYRNNGIGFIRAENVGADGKVSTSNIVYIDDHTHTNSLKRSILESQDLLICIAGTLGRSAVVEAKQLPLNTNQAVAFVRLVNSAKASVSYIQKSLSSFFIQQHLLQQTKVTAIPNLTLEIISNCVIPLPPTSEQHRIVESLEEVLPAIYKLESLQLLYK